MKAVITGLPQFEMEVTQAMVEGLLALSQEHYDHTCKAAGRLGGLLWGWKNLAAWSLEYNQPLVVSGSFRELDLTLKICESLPYAVGRSYYEDVGRYRAFVGAVLQRSQQLVGWREEFSLETEAPR